MTLSAKKILGIVLLIAGILMSSHALPHEQSKLDQTPGPKQESAAPTPDLADIIPSATRMARHLAALENKINVVLDISEIESKLVVIETNLKDPVNQLERLKNSKQSSLNRFISIGEAFEEEREFFDDINNVLGKAVRTLSDWRREWLAEKNRWHEWQIFLLEEGTYNQVKSTFEKANGTISKALNLILSQMAAMLKLQERASHIQEEIDTLSTRIDSMTLSKGRGFLIDRVPPMFSSIYWSQFGGKLWHDVKQGLDEIPWPDKRFFSKQGWSILLQIVLTLVLVVAIHRNREKLKISNRWRFLGLRPLSAGVFLGTMPVLWIYAYYGSPETWNLLILIIGSISLVRLTKPLNNAAWKNQFVFGLIIVLIIARFLYVISLPVPLIRLYTLLASLAGVLFCLKWAKESQHHKNQDFYTWSLRLLSFYFGYVIIAQISGQRGLAAFLFISLMRSLMVVITIMLFTYMIHGGLEWLFRRSPLQRTTVLYSDTETIIRRAGIFLNVTIWGLVLVPVLLVYWGAYDNFGKAMKGLLSWGFNLGDQRISIGLLIVAAGFFYGSLLLSWILQKLLMDEVLLKRQVERGIRISVGRLVHYALVLIGFLLALTILGFEITKLTIILSALGVGIGFGLQGVVNNFVSGLILLFERPVRVEDMVEIGGQYATVKRIGLRSTTVKTFDEADLIIPNANMVNNEVTNWTLGNRRVRVIIPVGVAYGSDVPLVIETLAACGEKNSSVAKTPAPQVLFLSFGANSLDFELRVWILDVDQRLKTRSQIHQEIDRRFREAKIEIAFPQRDLHLRSVDESVHIPLPKTSNESKPM
jgi:small-conductance mechanosensitive channel